MVTDAALSQLLDMGIPRGRAKAALKRSKGDVMSGAERVFAGEFDDIPTDDEGSDTEASPSTKAQNVAEDDEPFSEDEDMESDEEGGIAISSDPYAGIFFSKDRVEKVIEAVEVEERRKVEVEFTEYEVGVLGRGAWMSGCPEQGEQQHLFQLYFRMEEPLVCPHGCGSHLERDHRDFFSLFPDFSTYTKHVKSIIHKKCAICNKTACLACGEKVDTTATRSPDIFRVDDRKAHLGKGVVEHDDLLHCLEIQGILIGVGLHMIERAFNNPITVSPPHSPPNKRSRGPRASTVPPNVGEDDDDEDADDDYNYTPPGGKQAARGTGYAGAGTEDRSGQMRAEKIQAKVDLRIAELLTHVRVYLPTLDRASGPRQSDHLVHPTALSHLRRRSGFVADMLRSDSLLDMVNRRNVYQVLFDWLQVVSSHESLASMLGMPQMRPAVAEVDEKDTMSMTVTYEGSASPRELLESCVIQAQAALKGLAATKVVAEVGVEDEEELKRMSAAEKQQKDQEERKRKANNENDQLEDFCNRIITSAANIDKSLTETKGADFVKRMRDSLPKLPEAGYEIKENGSLGATDEEVIKAYEEWVSKVRFQYCDMSISDADSESIRYYHAFTDRIEAIANVDAPKRSLAIAKEMAILTRNLPVAWHSSVFLRVDESRVDAIKAMIIGPEGTPYENGCFVFDIFLPLDYNLKSPDVKSMTTNGGKYRYNPNLYADGKVCLSLLGTWSGPGWIAGQSTLLQVLISIQSLIFCEEPYLNEPGWANQGGSAASKAYSANVRRMVMADAMANNIKTPPRQFENEVKTHFRLKAKSISAQIKRWKALDDGKGIAADGAYNHGSSQAAGAAANPAGTSETAFDKAAKVLEGLLDGLEGKIGGEMRRRLDD